MRTMTGRAGVAVAVAGLLATSGALAGPASAVEPDIAERLDALPGMTLVDEQEAPGGDRFFLLDFTQPVDHDNPDGDTFAQRVSVLHTDEGQPTVFSTTGYTLTTEPFASEPTELLGANEVGMEHRYAGESMPDATDWSHLDIRQAAYDQHRVYATLEEVYDQNWISTGRSKGGMMATYYRYYFPDDMAGTVAYVAPNNPDPEDPSAYDDFLDTVGTAECRAQLEELERETLERRDELAGHLEEWAREQDATFDIVGGMDRSLEVAAMDLRFYYWQYYSVADCADLPTPSGPVEELFELLAWTTNFRSDQELDHTAHYYYQAATELGAPHLTTTHLEDLLRYPDLGEPAALVPPEVTVPGFDNSEIVAVDAWVASDATELMVVDGAADPWGAKPFVPAGEENDTWRFAVPDGDHTAVIADLPAPERADAEETVLRWADVSHDDREREVAEHVTPAEPATHLAPHRP